MGVYSIITAWVAVSLWYLVVILGLRHNLLLLKALSK